MLLSADLTGRALGKNTDQACLVIFDN